MILLSLALIQTIINIINSLLPEFPNITVGIYAYNNMSNSFNSMIFIGQSKF